MSVGIACSLAAALTATASAAETGVSNSKDALPGRGVSGVTQLCGPSPSYSCDTAGYAGQSTGWWGRYYGAGYASSNSYGYHNCTLYAAYRIAQNGVGSPGWSANADGWASDAAAHGTPVDQTPAVGAIAQWNRDHVAYVEVVTSSYIEITDDNYGLNTTDRFRIAVGSPAWPDNFIHFKDITPPTPAVATMNMLQHASFEGGDSAGWVNLPASPSDTVNLATYQAGGLPEGRWYLETNTSQVGGSVYQDVSATLAPGQSYSFSAWIRVHSPHRKARARVCLTLWGLWTKLENGQTCKTIGTTWTRIEAPYDVATPGSDLRAQLYEETAGINIDLAGTQLIG